MRYHLKTKVFWNLIVRGELPVSVKPGWILSQLVPKHGLELSYDPTKHKPREKSTGLPLPEEHLGVRRYGPIDQGFIGRSASEHRNTSKYLQRTLACVLKCDGML